MIQDRSKTQDVIRFWNLRYQRTLADFEKARSEAPSAGEPLASDPEVRQKQQEATQKMLEAERTLRKIDGELRELDLEFKALTLRLKTIRGDWKPWIVHWEK